MKRHKVVTLAFSVGIFTLAAAAFFVTPGLWLKSSVTVVPPAENTTVSEKIIAATTETAHAAEVGLPVQLLIPDIGVNAKIEHLGLTKEGAVQAPAGAKEVSWFTLGSRPGQPGSAVISGHYGRWKNGTDSVFNLLPDVKRGDTIHVKDEGGVVRSFVVQDIRVYGKDEVVPEIFAASTDALLNIITCHGTYLEDEQTYDRRLVVFAKMK